MPGNMRLPGRHRDQPEVLLAVVNQDRTPAAAADQPAIIASQRQRGHSHGLAREHAEQGPIRADQIRTVESIAAVTISRPSAGKAMAVTLSA